MASTSFEVQQEPTVAEVEVGVVSVLLHQLKQLRIQNLSGWKQTEAVAVVLGCPCVFDGACTYLDERAHVGKVGVHGASVGEILVHSLHQLSEAAEGHDLWDT